MIEFFEQPLKYENLLSHYLRTMLYYFFNFLIYSPQNKIFF